MGLMDGKSCVITGGAGSIGLASAALLLKEGGNIALVDRDPEELARAKQFLASDRVTTQAADVTHSGQTQKYIDHAVAAWGHIDVLFANAGVSGTNAPISIYPEEIFDDVINVNVKGSFLALKYAIPHMRPGGSIIITSSIMGVTARPNSVGYITSKHALIGMVRCAAHELADKNIRVNVLAPGPTDNEFQKTIEDRITATTGVDATEMLNNWIPLGRHGQPDEIAETVLFLASDKSSFSTGGVFMADGGMHI